MIFLINAIINSTTTARIINAIIPDIDTYMFY